MIRSNVEAFIMLRREVDLCSLVVEIPVWCFIVRLTHSQDSVLSVCELAVIPPYINHRKGACPQKRVCIRRKTGNVSVPELWKRLERRCPISLIFSAQASNGRASIVLNMPQS
ncbi:hypothetical protein XENOCAPTIV_022484 [Xenoophorus captivus]|uniref:Uncharacterized protein n=1 Tax=Xenoophorus captivus TaxID=1517983 RepID=A0ABV0QUD0_9TELE